MASPMKSSAVAYAANKLTAAGLAGLSPHTTRYPSLLDAALDMATKTNAVGIGALCQLHTILTSGQAPKAKWSAVQRLISSRLEYHATAESAVDQIKAAGFTELSKYGPSLTYSYITKNINLDTMVAFAAMLSSSMPAVCALMSQCEHGTWSKFGDEWGFDETEYMIGVNGLLLDQLIDIYGNTTSIIEGCSRYSTGPFPNGYMASLSSATNGSTPAVASPNLATMVANVRAAANAISGIPSTPTSTPTTNSGVSAMPTTTTTALASLNAAYKPIIDGMFTQSGLSITVDQIIADIVAKGAAEDALKSAEQIIISTRELAEDTINDLKRKLSTASNTAAMPSTISILSHSTTIPGGTMHMVDASSLFPLMAGVKFKVPHFTWDHAHPDVPSLNDSYIFRKEMLLKAVRCLAKGENFWLSGHTGSGKTTFIEQVASRLGWPVARVAFDSNVDRSELVGRMSLAGDGKGGTTSSWLPGILERAITNGYILLCDEMDAGHPNALYTLQPLLEGKSLTLLEDGGRIVPASPMFRMCATGNTTGNGDPSGLYPACRILSAATLDRFQTFINVPYMTLEEEVALISNTVPSLTKTLTNKLAKFAGEMRNAFTTNQTPISYSPRRSVAFAREVEDMFNMGFKDEKEVLSAAFKSKLYDAASEEFRQRLTEIANSSLGGIDPTKGIQ